ncbi:MAG: elongation factor 1-beta [Candidatus ainarchaeum sp.]|nr:elongation factor 1-beta [Candidatus ainarchaeum sp.]MDD3975648.1 elongation factor 1-beta [Candidatus ainarchaeum sp.]
MGDIMTVYRIYPEDMEYFDSIKEFLEKGIGEPYKIYGIKEEPIAFGLKLLKVNVIYPEKVEGLLDKLENILEGINGVNQIEVEASTLI